MLDGYGSIINTKKLTIPTISYCPELLFYIELLNLYVFLNTLPFFGGSYFETIPKFVTGKKNYKFYACLGPQIGIRTYAYEQVKIAGYVYLPDSLNYTADQRFQKVDVGVALQTGAQLYATPHLYFDLGLSAYQGVFDINGKALQELGWYDKNHLSYQKSYNFRGGIMLGIHYMFWHQRGGLLDISNPGEKK